MLAFMAAAGRIHAVNPFIKKRKEIVTQAGAATNPATKEEQSGED